MCFLIIGATRFKLKIKIKATDMFIIIAPKYKAKNEWEFHFVKVTT